MDSNKKKTKFYNQWWFYLILLSSVCLFLGINTNDKFESKTEIENKEEIKMSENKTLTHTNKTIEEECNVLQEICDEVDNDCDGLIDEGGVCIVKTIEHITASVIDNLENNCHPSYSGCLRADASDYDCLGGSGNGPYYTGKVMVIGPDVFGLDRDGDGWGCE